MTEQPSTFTATRDQLIEALTRLDVYPATTGPGQRTFVVAESMADAIIEALAADPDPVHYRWPVVCGDFSSGDLWTGNLDRVTCAACRSRETAAPEAVRMAAVELGGLNRDAR